MMDGFFKILCMLSAFQLPVTVIFDAVFSKLHKVSGKHFMHIFKDARSVGFCRSQTKNLTKSFPVRLRLHSRIYKQPLNF